MTKLRNPLLLEGVLSRAIEDCGGVDAVADELGVSPQLVRDWLRTDEKRIRLSYDDARRLSRLSPVFAQDLAERAGMRLVPADGADASAFDLMAPMSDLTREFGEVMTELGKALADGVVTGSEKSRVMAELQHLKDAALRMMKSLNGGGVV